MSSSRNHLKKIAKLIETDDQDLAKHANKLRDLVAKMVEEQHSFIMVETEAEAGALRYFIKESGWTGEVRIIAETPNINTRIKGKLEDDNAIQNVTMFSEFRKPAPGQP